MQARTWGKSPRLNNRWTFLPLQAARIKVNNWTADQRAIFKVEETPNQPWVRQVQAVAERRDEVAFAQLFAHFAPRLKGMFMKAGATPAEAEDLAQDVMATLWHKAHLFNPALSSVSTWVYTIARNRRIDDLRKSKHPMPDELPWGPGEEPDAADVLAMQEEVTRLADALAALPPEQRAMIEESFFAEKSHGDIADTTGLPLGTIKSRIRLALERLRHRLN